MKLYAAELDMSDIAREFNVPTDFSAEVLNEAERAQDRFADSRRDLRQIPFVTIDPPGSMDLDQAVNIRRSGENLIVTYAIADVAAFVEPNGAIEVESIRRGQTMYLPGEPVRLHPPQLSEDKASLLPNVDRPAVVWTFEITPDGDSTTTSVERALIHSVARLDYEGVDRDIRNGTLHQAIADIEEVGRRRAESDRRRSAINLRMPSQRVHHTKDGRYELLIEPRPPIMDYNSEISLLTGMAAADMAVEAGHGILRTLPDAEGKDIEAFWAETHALGFEREANEVPGAFLARIDADSPRGMAMMREALSLLRGADYALVGTPEATTHAGVGGYYSHVTAPLRRLVDRFSTEHCLAIAQGIETPSWVRDKHEEVLEAMRSSSHVAGNVERAVLALTEATVLEPSVGESFDAVVLDSNQEKNSSKIFIAEPPVLADAEGAPEAGTETRVVLTKADPVQREVNFKVEGF